MDPRALTVAFNEQINNRDLEGLAQLMTDDHTFIDTADHPIRGTSDCLDAWRGFFEAFPDYRNTFDRLVVEDNKVTVAAARVVRIYGWTAPPCGSRRRKTTSSLSGVSMRTRRRTVAFLALPSSPPE